MVIYLNIYPKLHAFYRKPRKSLLREITKNLLKITEKNLRYNVLYR